MGNLDNYFELNSFNEKHIIFNKKSFNNKALRPAMFFDRDGVIIEDMHYICESKDVAILKGIKELLLISHELGWLNIVITNQSGIARGLFKWQDYEKVTFKMLEMLGSSYLIDGIYANSADPFEKLSSESWRKPNPNMIIQAASDFDINLKESILIGDRLTDLLAGYNAGLRKFVHVLTGHGIKERKDIEKKFLNKYKNNNVYLIDNLITFPINKLLTI